MLYSKMANILVIDDNRSVRQTLQFCLEEAGHFVDVAEDGAEGLNVALDTIVDLVLIDVNMPGLPGIAVCQEIKTNEELRHLPVVMMTGCRTNEVVANAMAAGALEVLNKPFELEKLLASIARWTFAPDSKIGTASENSPQIPPGP